MDSNSDSLSIGYYSDYEGNSPAYGEQDADRIDVFTVNSDHIVTLYRAENSSRWTDVPPGEVQGDTLLWLDLDTWIEENVKDVDQS